MSHLVASVLTKLLATTTTAMQQRVAMRSFKRLFLWRKQVNEEETNHENLSPPPDHALTSVWRLPERLSRASYQAHQSRQEQATTTHQSRKQKALEYFLISIISSLASIDNPVLSSLSQVEVAPAATTQLNRHRSLCHGHHPSSVNKPLSPIS